MPQLDQVPEDSSEIPMRLSKEPWDVFQERLSGSYFLEDAEGFRPEIARIVARESFPCN
jgi:hypothetical protein